jgi:hypothetical protein
MTNQLDSFKTASIKTAAALQTITATPKIAELSRLSFPEIQQLTDQIAQVVPAGNVLGLILSGLTRIEGRQVPPIDVMFRRIGSLTPSLLHLYFPGHAMTLDNYRDC